MEQQYNKGIPVCSNCGAICGAGHNNCRYCGSSLEDCSKISTNANVSYPKFQENPVWQKTPTSVAYENGKKQQQTIESMKSANKAHIEEKHQNGEGNKFLSVSLIAFILGIVSVVLLILSRSSAMFALSGMVVGILALLKNMKGTGFAIAGVSISFLVLLLDFFGTFNMLFYMF
ncbi:MAG: hypothetical protein RSB38_03480 [Oscillospiraceae bacterium]